MDRNRTYTVFQAGGKLADHLGHIIGELDEATKRFGPMRSTHEGYAILREEVDEMWDAIKANDTNHARAEAVQVAAMAIRFLMDIKPEEAPSEKCPGCDDGLCDMPEDILSVMKSIFGERTAPRKQSSWPDFFGPFVGHP